MSDLREAIPANHQVLRTPHREFFALGLACMFSTALILFLNSIPEDEKHHVQWVAAILPVFSFASFVFLGVGLYKNHAQATVTGALLPMIVAPLHVFATAIVIFVWIASALEGNSNIQSDGAGIAVVFLGLPSAFTFRYLMKIMSAYKMEKTPRPALAVLLALSTAQVVCFAAAAGSSGDAVGLFPLYGMLYIGSAAISMFFVIMPHLQFKATVPLLLFFFQIGGTIIAVVATNLAYKDDLYDDSENDEYGQALTPCIALATMSCLHLFATLVGCGWSADGPRFRSVETHSGSSDGHDQGQSVVEVVV